MVSTMMYTVKASFQETSPYVHPLTSLNRGNVSKTQDLGRNKLDSKLEDLSFRSFLLDLCSVARFSVKLWAAFSSMAW